jgi:hypothetical protein
VKRSLPNLLSLLVLACLLQGSCGGQTGTPGSNAGGETSHEPEPGAGTSGDAGAASSLECTNNKQCGGGSCIFGRCVVRPQECRPSKVICNEPPPGCAEGEMPSVVDGCWGDCVFRTECGYLDDCDICTQNELLCLEWEQEDGSAFGCTSRPDNCVPLDCDCLSPRICGALSCIDTRDDRVVCLQLGEQ